MSFFSRLAQALGIDNNPLCRDCEGRGAWQVDEEEDGMITRVVNYCETCQGTGVKKEGDGDVD